MLPMVLTQLQGRVLTLPSCYKDTVMVDRPEVLVVPNLAGNGALKAALARLAVVVENSLE